MKHKRRMQKTSEWLPPQARYAHLPASTYTAEHRTPMFELSLAPGDNSFETDVYFANLSAETLDWVSSETGGFQTAGEDLVPVGGKGRTYRDVLPGEAVLVDVFHEMYDSDFLLQPSVSLSSPSLGRLEITGLAEKGKVVATVLVWDTGEAAKGITVRKL